MNSTERLTLLCAITALLMAFTPGAVFSAESSRSGPRFAELYSRDFVEQNLLPLEKWRPYASVSEREFWENLPDVTRKALLASGEKALGGPWQPLPASLYLEFARIGDRSNYEEVYFARRDRVKELALAECVENKGRFTDELVNGLWLILEETSWCIPAHIGAQKAGSGLPDEREPIVDLFAAETGALLGWVDYLTGPKLDSVSPLIRSRLQREVRRRILDPCLERDDFWWLGWINPQHVNNWNPWVCSNWITAALLLEQDPQRRVDAVWKAMRALDNFINIYHSDGGCDEGPSYWGRAGASLFDCLELLRLSTGGAVDVYKDPLIRNMGAYIYRAHISGDYFIDFADAPARVAVPADLIHRWGRRMGNRNMTDFGAWVASQRTVAGDVDDFSIGRLLPALDNLGELIAAPGRAPLVRDVWLDGIQVMAARSKDGSAGGFYLAAKGGHNNESHNHNDVGNFIVYCDGKPLLVDAGVGTYTAKTFSDSRYDIWTMQSSYHNLPTINGVMQSEGREFAAREVSYGQSGGAARFSLDIAGAYPPEAGVKSWKRALSLNRGKDVRLSDSFVLTKRQGELYLSLLTPCKIETVRPGELRLTEPRPQGTPLSVRVFYDSSRLTAAVEEITIDDRRLMASWQGNLYRIKLSAPEGGPLADKWELRLSR